MNETTIPFATICKSIRVFVCFGCLALLGISANLFGNDQPRPSRNQQPETPPNIVLIISDDQAWTDFGFMGHPAIQTPNLDRLASESLTFQRGYVPNSLCSPSLVSIITGLYPSQHHVSGNDPALPAELKGKESRRERFLELDRRLDDKVEALDTLPDLLAEKGYVSFQSGKWWHGSYQKGGFTDGMTHGDPERGGRHGDKGLAIGRKGLKPILDFIDGAEAKPFFVWYAPFLPHTPHNPPDRLLQKYQQEGRPVQLARYFAMCEWFDETCGQLVQQIDDRGLAENTLFVFVTDNGWIQVTPETAKPENWKKAFAPGSKQSPSEGGIRTPIMLRWKGKIVPCNDTTSLVSSIDLAPTILEAAGLEATSSMTGASLLGVTEASPLERDVVYGEIFAHDIADIDDPGKSLMYRWCIAKDRKVIQHFDGQTGRFGAIHRHQQGDRSTQLFDVANDPNETKNLAKQQPEEVEKLTVQLDNFFENLPSVK